MIMMSPTLRASLPFALLGALSLSGCVFPVSVGDDDVDHGGSGTDGSPPGSSGPGMSGGQQDGSTTGMIEESTGTDSGTAGETEGDTEGEPESVCDPQPGDERAWMGYVQGEPPDPFEVEHDAPCEVTAIVAMEMGQTLTLECVPEPQTLSVDVLSTIPLTLPLSVGQSVHLRVFEDITIDSGNASYVAISEPSGDLLLGYYHFFGSFDAEPSVASWYAPLTLQPAESVCEPEPYEPPTMDGDFVFDPCGEQGQRYAYDFQLDGGSPQRIFDRTTGVVGDYEIWVTDAQLWHPQEPECWYDSTHPSVRILMMKTAP